ncbi:MAG TPA: HAMP domain-containing sensor histidine kinase [Candidatus Didemnitutus sp.]|nr:HAMP domain-containing sensor histidine kinase [Candidatus Didemnitutus sp.]
MTVISHPASDLAVIAEQAARQAWRDVVVEQVAGPGEIPDGPEAGVDRMVIDCRGAAESDRELVAVCDAAGLPAFAVVARVRGGAGFSPLVVTVDERDWTVPVLAALLPIALETHRLRRENAEFRGDLRSIAVRVAHDLRSPVNGIVSGIEMVNDLVGRVAPSESGITAPLQESADELTRLIGQLALWARLAAARVERRRFDMTEPARRAREKFEARALLSGATLTAAGSWPSVIGDPEITEEVWRALIDNALLHAGEKPDVAMGWNAVKSECRFWVRDRGRGVEADKRGSLFHPFHRLHEPNAPRGFGLPIVERLMRLQGGRCEYEPNDDGGSTFAFYLPAGA